LETRRLVDRVGRAGIEGQALDEITDVHVAFGFDFSHREDLDRGGRFVVEAFDAGARDLEFFEDLDFFFLGVGLLRIRRLRAQGADAQQCDETETCSCIRSRQ